jgi:hypothetical protein
MNPAAPAPRPPAPRLAAEIAKSVTLSDDGKAVLTPTQTARQFFDALHAAGHHEDAIRFLAVALPKREAVWWGLVCVREVLKAPPEPQAKALAAAERWVRDPSEPNRRAAGTAAEAADYGNPPGSLAAGAFWSGGSIAPPNVPPVPPRDDLTGLAVGGALLLAAVTDPENCDAARGRFLAIGADVTAGKNKW